MALMALFGLLGIVVGVALVGFLVLTVWLAYKHNKYTHIPGPRRVSFFFGNVPTIIHSEKKKISVAEVMYQWLSEYGPVTCIWILHRAVVMVGDPQVTRDVVINKNLLKDRTTYSMLGQLYGARFMGQGLLTELDHSKWQTKRKTINPAFFRSSLKSLMTQFNESAEIYLHKLSTLADGKTNVNMALELHKVALDVIAKVAFGLDLNTIHDKDAKFVGAVDLAFEGIQKHFRSPFWRVDVRMYPYLNKVYDAIAVLRKVGRQRILEKKQLLNNGETSCKDILSMILRDSDLRSDAEIEDLVDEFVTFFVADRRVVSLKVLTANPAQERGQETTANMLSFLLVELLRKPALLERLTAEVDEVLGSKEFIEYEDLAKLQFLGQLIKETLRLYPPVPQVARQTHEKTSVGGYLIPASTTVQINVFTIHRNPKYWPDPEIFDPDRWTPGSLDEGGSNMSFIPFMLGPRNCIGQFFAQVTCGHLKESSRSKFEAKVLMARFFQQFNAQIVPEYQFHIGQVGTLRPRGGVPVTLNKREL